jgi:hypothetical protein
MELSDGSESDGDFSRVKPDSDDDREDTASNPFPLEGHFKDARDKAELASFNASPEILSE